MLGIDFNRYALGSGRLLPESALRRGLGLALEGLELGLCLHRVGHPPAGSFQPFLWITADRLDRLIALLLSSRPSAPRGWLSVTFDDGYEDAADWVDTRAARYPEVDFLFFVCPEKTERAAGFRWDVAQRALDGGGTLDDVRALMEAPVDLEGENARGDLAAVVGDPAYRLASLDRVRGLTAHPNVQLGNHTNTHQKATRLSLEQVEREYAASTAAFERLFGPQRQFAFPFGTPVHHFDRRHVEVLRGLGDFQIWSTEDRPFLAAERGPGAVLPRYTVDGTKTHAETAAWLMARTALYRARGSKHDFTPDAARAAARRA